MTQNVLRRSNNSNNPIHVSVEPEESPRNSGSHKQRLHNNQQQHALHGEPLSRSNSQQTQQQWLPLPGAHEPEHYYTPVQAQIASAGRRVPDQGSSQKSIAHVARKQKKRKKRDTGNKPEPQDDKEELIAQMKAKLAKLQSRAGTGAQRQRKKPKIKVEGEDKLPDANPDSGSSAPGTSIQDIPGGARDHQTTNKRRANSSCSSSDSDTELFNSSSDDTE